MPCRHKAFSRQRWSISQKAEVEMLKRHKHGDHALRLRQAAAARYLSLIEPWTRELGEDARILDVACGATCLANQIPQGEKYFLDPLLDFYRRELPGSLPDLPEHHMICGEAEHMRFADGSFDLILCLRAISHVLNPELVLHELERVLRPDGVLLLSVVVWPVWLSRCYYRCSPWLPKGVFRNRLYCYSARGIRNSLARHFRIEREIPLARESWYDPSRELFFVCRHLS